MPSGNCSHKTNEQTAEISFGVQMLTKIIHLVLVARMMIHLSKRRRGCADCVSLSVHFNYNDEKKITHLVTVEFNKDVFSLEKVPVCILTTIQNKIHNIKY